MASVLNPGSWDKSWDNSWDRSLDLPAPRSRTQTSSTAATAVYLKRGEPHCLACDYCLDGLPHQGRCPECGGTYAMGEEWTVPSHHVKLLHRPILWWLDLPGRLAAGTPPWRMISMPCAYLWAIALIALVILGAWFAYN